MHGLVLALAIALGSSGCGSHYELVAAFNRLRGDAYALDAIPRDVGDGAALDCPANIPTIEYRGELIAYSAPIQVAAAFAVKLRRFERLVVDVATDHYGRAPDRLLHFGARVCRSVRGNPQRLSEHALGNALDLSGFEWKRAAGAPGTAAFRVSVQRDWSGHAGHAEFLHDLIDRVIAGELFRGVIGPGREGHANHVHLDQAPWSYTLF